MIFAYQFHAELLSLEAIQSVTVTESPCSRFIFCVPIYFCPCDNEGLLVKSKRSPDFPLVNSYRTGNREISDTVDWVGELCLDL